MTNPPKLVSQNFLGTAKKLKDAGTNSRKVGQQKTFSALNWVYRWGWSYPLLVDHIASPGRRGQSKKLVDQGLLLSFPSESAGGIKGIPLTTLCLTKDGQALVESEILREQLLDQNLKDDIPHHQLRHDALVQRATTFHENLAGFETPKEIATKSTAGVKQPDAIWILKEGLRLGLELEMTAKKSGREINQTILALLKAVDSTSYYKLDLIVILSQSSAILDNYKELLKPGSKFTRWGKDNSGKWVEVSTERVTLVPDWAKGKFVFTKFDL